LCFKFKDLGAYRQHCGQIHYLAQLLRDITSLENGKCYYVLAVIFFVFFSCRFLPAIFLASCYFIHSVFCPRSVLEWWQAQKPKSSTQFLSKLVLYKSIYRFITTQHSTVHLSETRRMATGKSMATSLSFFLFF
jgi:hypothetical protein